MLLKNLLTFICIFAMSATQVSSFQLIEPEITDGENSTGSLAIQVSDYTCFQNLDCLKRNNPFKNSNLDQVYFNSDRYKQYIVEGSSKNENMHAIYNGKGDLIKATVIQRNIVLPKSIYDTLVTDAYSSWKMIGNELVVQNFNQNRMTYKVILNSGDEVKVEYFDRKGKKVTPLS